MLLYLLLLPLVLGLEITSSGTFSNCQPPDSSSSQCTFSSDQVRWGKSTGQGRSGLEYTGFSTNFTLEPLEPPQMIGLLRHHNWPVTGYTPEKVDLRLNLTFLQNVSTLIVFTLDVHETLNQEFDLVNGTCSFESNEEWFGRWNSSYPCCPYWTPFTPCSDRIRFSFFIDINQTFVLNQTLFTLKTNGFLNENEIIEFFITQETFVSDGFLFGSIVQTCIDECPSSKCVVGECVNGACEFFPSGCECWDTCETCTSQSCFWCSGSCSSNEECDSSCGGDDDEDRVPILVAAAIVGTYCVLCLILLLVMGMLAIPFLRKVKSFRPSSGVRSSNKTLHGAQSNPLHEPRHEYVNNPVYD